ncbi:MAG: acyl-CoA dehydrogenase family protein [Proteobacteria bacterium]|nr:acyl-CoA dehydrogenase family protein [Pseudomonadota bacterium]
MIGPDPPLSKLSAAFQEWIDRNAERLAPYKQVPEDYEKRLESLRELQRELFDASWARYGWPERCGGLGGNVLHRAVVIDVLARNGLPPRNVFEHLEVLPPALERFAGPELLSDVFLPTLRGDVVWCQGFSEPTAGSDLASLRTRAERVEGGYRLDGHKIWTSWAKWATHLLLLARTGTTEERHRGLTAFVVATDAPGLQVGPIRQSNGTDELAEVFLDGVFVPDTQRVGEEGQGWAVAMHILAGERGSFAWLRCSETLPQIEKIARAPGAADHAGELGESLLRLMALRCVSRRVMEILARGEAPGPESSVSKVLLVDTEQHLYDVVRSVLSSGFDLGTCPDVHSWHERYLYSRAAGVYGGSRQIQLNVIAKLLLTRGSAPGTGGEDAEELQAVRATVAEALEKSEDTREALDGLDWWSFAASPDDAFGRAAFAAWFEGQGRRLATGPALAGVAHSAVAEALGAEPSELALALPAEGAGEWLVCGLDDGTRWLALETGPGSFAVVPAEGLEIQASKALDAELVVRVSAQGEVRPVEIDARAHARAVALARVAAAYEILGASRALLERAIAHTGEREQFGQPIGQFQAIQHLLAEAQVEVSALADLCEAALEEWSGGDGDDIARAAKAFAGRAGLAVAQRALQCFGAIGFTHEHDHHLYSRRIHTLDALWGRHRELRRELGSELVRSGLAPRGIDAWRLSEA